MMTEHERHAVNCWLVKILAQFSSREISGSVECGLRNNQQISSRAEKWMFSWNKNGSYTMEPLVSWVHVEMWVAILNKAGVMYCKGDFVFYQYNTLLNLENKK